MRFSSEARVPNHTWVSMAPDGPGARCSTWCAAGPWHCTVNDRWVLIAGTWAYLGSCPLPVGMEAGCLNGNGALGSKRPVGGGSGIHRKVDAATQLLRELPYMRLLHDGIMVAVHQVDVQP